MYLRTVLERHLETNFVCRWFFGKWVSWGESEGLGGGARERGEANARKDVPHLEAPTMGTVDV